MKPEDMVREYVDAYEACLREANKDGVPEHGTPEHAAWLESVYLPLMRREHDLLDAMRAWVEEHPAEQGRAA